MLPIKKTLALTISANSFLAKLIEIHLENHRKSLDEYLLSDKVDKIVKFGENNHFCQ